MTPSKRFGRRWTAIAAGALVLVLAGCGSQAKTVEVKKKVAPSPRKVLLASVQATTAAKSARLSMRMSAGGTFAVTGDGVTNFITGDTALAMQFAGVGSEVGGSIEIRVVDGDAYMKMPESLLGGGPVGTGEWLKIPNLGAANGALPGLGQSDPSQFLAYLETVSAGVKKVGSETIRGVATTHYTAMLDLAKAIDRADVPESLRDDLGKVVENGRGSFEMPADVWVDNDGLARRIQLKLDLGKMVGTDRETGLPVMTMSMDLYDFGVPVHVEAPPADEVTEIPFPFGETGSTGADGAAA
jgi:hypothetical protein